MRTLYLLIQIEQTTRATPSAALFLGAAGHFVATATQKEPLVPLARHFAHQDDRAMPNVTVEHWSTLFEHRPFEDPTFLQHFLDENGVTEPTLDIEELLGSAELSTLLETTGPEFAFDEPFFRLLDRAARICHFSIPCQTPRSTKMTASKGVRGELASTQEDAVVQLAAGPALGPDVHDLPDWVDFCCVDNADDRWSELIARVITHGRELLASYPTQTLTFNIAFNYKTMEVRFIFYHDGGLKCSPPADLRTEDGLRAFMRGVFCGVVSRHGGRTLELPLAAWVSSERWDAEELLHFQLAQNELSSSFSSDSPAFANNSLSPEAHSRAGVLGTVKHLDYENEELLAVACLTFGYPNLAEYRIPDHDSSNCDPHVNDADMSLRRPTRRLHYTMVKCHSATDAPTPRMLLETMMHAMLGTNLPRPNNTSHLCLFHQAIKSCGAKLDCCTGM